MSRQFRDDRPRSLTAPDADPVAAPPATEATPTAEASPAGADEPVDGPVALGVRDRRLESASPAGGAGESPPYLKVLVVLMALTACLFLVHNLGWVQLPWALAGSSATAVGPLLGPASGSVAADIRIDPSATRIGNRLVTLVAVAARARLGHAGQDVPAARGGIIGWVAATGAGDEVEEPDRAILLHPPGSVGFSDLAVGSWQIEGAVVLAWALDLLDELPRYDQPVDPGLLGAVLGFPEAPRTLTVLRSSGRRAQADIETEHERYEGIHHRLQELAATDTGLPRRPRTETEDGSTGGTPVAMTDPEAVDVALSITAERLRALKWLRVGGPYSAVGLDG